VSGRPSRVSIALALAAFGVTAAHAQQPRPTLTASIARAAATRGDSTRRDPGDEREVAGVVVAAAAPRSYRVVNVPVPAELAGASKVTYEVVASGNVPLLGARSGTVARGSVVVLTVGVPVSAQAGLTRAGFVRFTATGGATPVRAPIDVAIARVARIDVTPTQSMRGAQAGDRLELAFTILNAGNLQDTLDLEVDAPRTWNPRLVGAPILVLARGESIERSVTAAIPLFADLGDVAVTMIARSRSGERAVASAIVEVTDPLHSGRRPGPVITLGAGSVMSAGLPSRSVESVAIDGPLTDALSVSGRFSTPTPNDLVNGRALSSLGYNSQSNFLSMNAPTWGATLGTTGVSLGDLGGQNVFGRGGSLRIGAADERLQFLAAAPLVAQGTWNTPTLIAAGAQQQLGSSMLTAFFSHLRDSTFLVRSVDAGGVLLETEPWANAFASGALASRSYSDGSGIGAEADFRGPVAGGDLAFRAVHAPGGTLAFAPARDVLTVGVDRALGRLRTNFNYWSTQDGDARRASIGSTGWSLSPTYDVFSTFTLGANVMHSAITSRDSLSGFGSTQVDYGLRARFLAAGFDIGADTRLTNVAQSIADSIVSIEDGHSERVVNQLRVDHVGVRGVIGVGGSIETASFGTSSTPPQSSWGAHLERFQFWPRFPRWTVSAAAQHLQYGEVSTMTSRAELNVDVFNSLRIALGAERGTARDQFGALHTMITLKVERASSISAFERRQETGVVYQDRNANGVRDPGEPGVAGIVVHRGPETAVTDANGEFRMTGGSSARADVDDRSLPKGWEQSPRLLDRASDPLVLGVIPITALDVRIDVAPLADGTVPSVRVGVATLALRDSAGREWVARADASQHASFDALPAGRYTLTMELDGSSEPLLIDPIPTVEIGGTPGRQRLVLTVRTRPIRIFKTKQQTEKRGNDGSVP
jgi:hypothetical protein